MSSLFKSDYQEKIEDVFKAIDSDKNGYLDEKEFVKGMSKVLGNVSEAEIKAIFKNLDVKSDGMIAFNEFMLGAAGTLAR